MLEMRHIFKSFGRLRVLEDVTLAFAPGRVHGLLGENGAGKSTLMNILFGLMAADAGEIVVDGRAVRIGSPRAAQALGIGMVHQHFKLVPTLSTAENLALAMRERPGAVGLRAEAWLERLGWKLPLQVAAGKLSVGQQQRAEILKALLTTDRTAQGKSGRTLILDEPTAVLTPQEVGELFAAVRSLKAGGDSGGAAVIFITHKLAEVESVCDEVAILRRGRVVHAGAREGISVGGIAAKMIGEAAAAGPVEAAVRGRAKGPVKLALRGVRAGMLRGVSLEVRAGEILGIAGVDGNGQSDLLAALVGDLRLRAGKVEIGGRDCTRMGIRERLKEMAVIPDDRHRLAAALPLSVTENLLLKDYRRRPFSRAGVVLPGAWRRAAREAVRAFDVRTEGVSIPLARLSGGNQQKVVLARELGLAGKAVVVAANPTRGLDIAATAFVLRQLRAARDRAGGGAAIVLIHADLDELLGIADRIAVLYNGTLTAAPAKTKEAIAPLMLGMGG
ncbi:MAG TPA: ATP-binding cassette domain-containing protein [Phycisphaerae bacterium]|nr:ATP-binding cassette domain-containing protein [Phycisphaerae bacterium]